MSVLFVGLLAVEHWATLTANQIRSVDVVLVEILIVVQHLSQKL